MADWDSPLAAGAVVELRGVSKHYQLGDNRIDALRQVSLAIRPGEFVAVWGPSGSGKSTLCNLVGLLDTPSSGQVLFDGVDVGTLSDNQRSTARNRNIGFVFQNFNLVPVLSALENVMLPLQVGGARGRVARAAALRRLEEVGLASHVAHRPARMSGGQQQRVAIARALIGSPALVVADEPTANLDSTNALKVIALMRQISHAEGTAFIFSTHDERLLERVDRRLRMHDGELVEESAPPRHGPQAQAAAPASRSMSAASAASASPVSPAPLVSSAPRMSSTPSEPAAAPTPSVSSAPSTPPVPSAPWVPSVRSAPSAATVPSAPAAPAARPSPAASARPATPSTRVLPW